jgi:uncharacterized protein (DUF2147 family)
MEYSAMKFRSAFALAILVAATTAARADDSEPPTAKGFWEALDDSGKPEGWFLFTQKNDVYSARLVKGFKKEGDDTPPPMTCTKCVGKKKGAHIMGLTLFWGMKRDGLTYTDGSVLDPRDGSIYHAKMWIDEDGKMLHVRGYLGISLFGKTQDWRRLPDDAMSADDIPKEILASGEVDHSDKADKPKHAAADKSKHKKSKSAKAEKLKPPKADDSDADSAEKDPQ